MMVVSVNHAIAVAKMPNQKMKVKQIQNQNQKMRNQLTLQLRKAPKQQQILSQKKMIQRPTQKKTKQNWHWQSW
jgi:hypothetical protein